MLVIVGLGVSKDFITMKAVEELQRCNEVLVDTYTSVWYPSIDELLKFLKSLNPNTKLCKRRDLEGESMTHIVRNAIDKNICIAVPGDPLFATTHSAIIAEARRFNVKTIIIPGISIINFVYAYTCLQPYRFGKIATIVSPKDGIFYEYPIQVVKENRERNLHTILLLEIDLEKGYFMTPQQAMEILLEAQHRTGVHALRDKDLVFVLSAIGSKDQCAEVTTVRAVTNSANKCRAAPATIVVPAPRLHPVEEECVESLYGESTPLSADRN